MPPTATVTRHPDSPALLPLRVVVPDTPSELFGAYSGRDEVVAAVRTLDVLDNPADWLYWTGQRFNYLHEFGISRREGPVWRAEVSPGTFALRCRDFGRTERTQEAKRLRAPDGMRYRSCIDFDEEGEEDCGKCKPCRYNNQLDRDRVSAAASLATRDHFAAVEDEIREKYKDARRRRTAVRCWSRKSRTNMTLRLATLDYRPMMEVGAPAMTTLTLPRIWLPLAPNAAVAYGLIRKLLKRYRRAWGHEFVGTWKREFQERGAPHWHILHVPPAGLTSDGRTFDQWLADEWTQIVGAESCGRPDPEWVTVCDLVTRKEKRTIGCCERHRHHASHSTPNTVDRREGSRYTDPRRAAVYFSKHGSFSAKDYQNEAPAAWLADESVGIGRFWGYWGLRPLVAVTEVPEYVARALQRTVRRWQAATQLRDRSQRPAVARRRVWRKKHFLALDPTTGELVYRFKWVRRWVKTRIEPRMRGRGGFICLNDAPGVVEALSRVAAAAHSPNRSCSASGAGPVGFLP